MEIAIKHSTVVTDDAGNPLGMPVVPEDQLRRDFHVCIQLSLPIDMAVEARLLQRLPDGRLALTPGARIESAPGVRIEHR